MTFDVTVIGAGLVGLATARAVQRRFPQYRLVVLDKESEVAAHQSGHNSGVIHAGLYYKPGSLKARLCLEGRYELARFCEEHDVRYELCGKLVVATHEEERGRLMDLAHRALQNGVHVRVVDAERMREIEPHVNGVAAIHSPQTGIADYPGVAAALRDQLSRHGAEIRLNSRVTRVESRADEQVVHTASGEIRTRWLISCAGLYADQVARAGGVTPEVQIVPFRGEYYLLREDRQSLVRNLIYPVPDPRFPFLGVHLTRMVRGGVEAGPNAVLAFAREGYTRDAVNLRELIGTLGYAGFWRLAAKYPTVGVYEMYRSVVKAEFARALQRLVPEIRSADLLPGGAGVRAQALLPDGRLVDDFAVHESPRALHVLNAPSPAATASLAIGRYLTELAARNFGWPERTAVPVS